MARYGRVSFVVSYVVDFDDVEMVADAKQAVFEDVMNAVKYDEVPKTITVTEDPTATSAAIPEFLLEYRRHDDSSGT